MEFTTKNILARKKPLLLLLIGIFIGTLLLFWQANVVPEVSYADGVSYMSATGNQGLYEHNTLTGQWVNASEWKAFWQESSFFQFDKIRYDIAHYDIHPPLYFWILHIWTKIVGVALSTGPLLNICFHVFTAILMFLICLRLRCTYYIAVAAGLFWLLNSSMITAAQETRQYSLLALVAVLYLLSLLVYFKKKSYWALGFIALAAVLGMLTHYHFALLIGVSVIYLSLFFIMRNEGIHLVKYFAALGAGAILFIILHPDFYVSFERQTQQAQVFAVENIVPRTIILKSTLIELFKLKFPIGWFQKLTLFLGILSAILLIIHYKFKQKSRLDSPKDVFKNHEWLPFFAALMTSLIIFVLYVFQFSPKHAMNPKYIMLVTPLYFIVIAQFSNLVISKKILPYIIILLLCLQTLDTTLNIRRFEQQSKQTAQTISETMQSGIPIILDFTGRGVLPRILWHVDNTTKVYATSQKYLITEIPEIENFKTIFFISNLEYHENTEVKRQLLLEKFNENGYEIEANNKNLFGSEIFLLKKR